MQVEVVDMDPPLQVEVWNADLDTAIQSLKKLIARDGLFKKLKEREEPSSSIRRRTKERKARR